MANYTRITWTEATRINVSNLNIMDAGIKAVDDKVNTHIGTITGNPHGVNKSDVGLANLSNYSVASQIEAEAGTTNSKYMTPLRSKNFIDESKANGDFGYVRLWNGSQSVSTSSDYNFYSELSTKDYFENYMTIVITIGGNPTTLKYKNPIGNSTVTIYEDGTESITISVWGGSTYRVNNHTYNTITVTSIRLHL